MEWDSGGRSSRPGLGIWQNDHVVPHKPATTRSRSPSRERQDEVIESGRRYRERSRSPSRRGNEVLRGEGRRHDEDGRSRSSRSRNGTHHHRQRRRDGDSERSKDREMRREREHGRPSHPRRRDNAKRECSPTPNSYDYWDDRDVVSQFGSRYSSSHHCIDSALKQHHGGGATLSPTPTPPNAQTVRFPPPETERHYTSHCCHHHSHHHSPTRSTTPRSHSSRHRHRQRIPSPNRRSAAVPRPAVLPYGARALSRWDFAAFEPLFGHHLELHQQVRMADLDEESVRDWWKVFVAKWNLGELEKSWYEPEMFLRVVRLRALEEARVRTAAAVPVAASTGGDGHPGVMTPPMTGASFASEMMESVVSDMTGYSGVSTVMGEEEDDDDDEYGPPMPPPPAQIPQGTTALNPKPGPTIPTLQDLELRRTLEAEAEESRLSDIHLSRRADRTEQKARLDELIPRAEAGTRERQLEKRRLTTQTMREFASARETGEMAEVPDKELLGGGADDYRRLLANLRRRRTEREVGREEVLRARNAERDERVRGYRAREEGTVEALRELARERFGA